MAKLGPWLPLWIKYPDYIFYPDSSKVKQTIGGSVNQAWLVNTCAIRISRTLNYNGLALPRGAGMVTKKGGDGKRYAIRVAEISKWMRWKLGKPDFEHRKKEGDVFDKTTLAGMRGIIGFRIRFGDATGHIDLWDGKRFSNEGRMSKSAWSASTRIWLWKAK